MVRKKAFIARVYGIVQGVGFRYSAVTYARRLGLCGYVRNMDDGSVEVVAEGEEGKLNSFKKWLDKGPPGASVRKVDIKYIPFRGFYRSFNIEY